MREAAATGARLLHTFESCLSEYAGTDFDSFHDFDWELLRKETADFCEPAKELGLSLVLGSAHFLDTETKPTFDVRCAGIRACALTERFVLRTLCVHLPTFCLDDAVVWVVVPFDRASYDARVLSFLKTLKQLAAKQRLSPCQLN